MKTHGQVHNYLDDVTTFIVRPRHDEFEIKRLTAIFFNQQDTLIGLRHQLDEVKAINVEMYQKMQVQTTCIRTVGVNFHPRSYKT